MTNPLRATTDLVSGDRLYIGSNTQETFLSVTTILGAIPKQFYLVPWAAKLVAENALGLLHEGVTPLGMEPDEIVAKLKDCWKEDRDTAGMLGDECHTAAEEMLSKSLGKPDIAQAVLESLAETLSADAYKRLGFLVQFLRDNEVHIKAVEFTIFNEEQGYAGTCDFAAVINGKPGYIDIKTGRAVHPDAALQMAAYARGEYIMDDSPDKKDMPFAGIPVDALHGWVLHLQKTKCRLIEADISDEVFDCFCCFLLTKKLWLGGVQDEALGSVVYDSKKGV